MAFQKLLRKNLRVYAPANFPGDVGLAFSDWITPDETLPLLEEQKAQLKARLAAVAAIPAHTGSLALIFSHQTHHLQAELAWLEEIIENIKNKA
jgi:hypothetical protein